MMHNKGCNNCSAFIPNTDLLISRCKNENGAPLHEDKIFAMNKKGCPIWSGSVPKAD
jgi:hypothetical protein